MDKLDKKEWKDVQNQSRQNYSSEYHLYFAALPWAFCHLYDRTKQPYLLSKSAEHSFAK